MSKKLDEIIEKVEEIGLKSKIISFNNLGVIFSAEKHKSIRSLSSRSLSSSATFPCLKQLQSIRNKYFRFFISNNFCRSKGIDSSTWTVLYLSRSLRLLLFRLHFSAPSKTFSLQRFGLRMRSTRSGSEMSDFKNYNVEGV